MDAIYEFMICYVILINMIIKDEREHNVKLLFVDANIGQLRKSLTFQAYMKMLKIWKIHKLFIVQKCLNW